MQLKVRNWSKFQHYKDRNPPWIKLHFELLSSKDWVVLDDASRVLAVACMLVASRNEGLIDATEAGLSYIKRVAYLNGEPDLKPLISCGFLEPASECKQTLAEFRPETETETEKDICASPNGDTRATPTKEIVSLYHKHCPQLPQVAKLTPARQQAIRARWRNELPSLDDWQRYFGVVAESSFLTGNQPPTGGRSKPFTADFDFLIKQGNVVKVMEGKYDD